MLMFGKKRIIDIECRKENAFVLLEGKTMPIKLNYDFIQWVSEDWFD